MAKNELFDKGIVLAGSFSVPGAYPLDAKSVVETIEDLNDHVTNNRAYEGLIVYVKEEQTNYQYTRDGWILLANSDYVQVDPTIKIQANNVIQDSTHKFVTDEQIEAWNTGSNLDLKLVSQTDDGLMSKEDKIKLDNTIKNNIIVSSNADYAEVGEWVDGNVNNEIRTGYFVTLDNRFEGTVIRKGTSTDDIRGVTMEAPAFSGNADPSKYDNDGNLLPKYSYVGIMGIVPVYDYGRCDVGERCMPDDAGTAVPSNNNMGYQVIKRVDARRILIIVEPGCDMLNRIKTDTTTINNKLDGIEEYANNYILPISTELELGGIKAKEKTNETLEVAIDPETGKAYAESNIELTEEAEEWIFPEIKDNEVSEVDTWSSSKISQQLNPTIKDLSYKNGIFTITKTDGTIATLTQTIYKNNKPTDTSEFHYQNEIIYSSNPVETKCIGWVCITEGYPGSWVAFGELAI